MTPTPRERAAQRWARAWNVSGRSGGWIYENDTETPIVQGWSGLYLALRWLRVIEPDGTVHTEYGASVPVLRKAYRDATAWQRSTHHYL